MEGKNKKFNFLAPTQYWDEKRERIFKWLAQEAPSLAELYRGAVIILNFDIPGKIRFVSHAVREIRNRLPEEASAEKTKYLQYKNEMDRILEKWEKEGLPLGGSIPMSMGEEKNLNNIKISKELFTSLSIFLYKHKKIRETVRKKQEKFFKRLSRNKSIEPIGPIIKNWVKLTEWFVGKVHDSERLDHDYDLKEFNTNFKKFEDFLLAFANEFFKNMEVLDEILEKANS